MPNNGETLNQRVWKLFEEAGFETQPNSEGLGEYEVPIGRGRPVDLYATISELNIKIIGSNKSGARPRAGQSWTGHMNDLDSLRQAINADKALLVVTHHELDEADYAHAESIGIKIWTADQLEYFEALVASIGKYAKYEIIDSLSLVTQEESDIHKVLGLKIKQPTSAGSAEIYMFSLSPERLLRTSVIYRKAQGRADAYQRMLKRVRLPNIGEFVSRDDAILPTDIILHLNDNVSVQELSLNSIRDTQGRQIPFSNNVNYAPVIIDIPMRYASMEIIDGQHRLYGFVHADDAIRSNFNLVVVGVRNLAAKQKRETFIAINDNSRRMDPNLVAYLKYTTDDSECQADAGLMAIRVVVILNEQAPFKRQIKLLDIGQEKITLRGFSGYDLKGLLGPRGLLRKYNSTNDPAEYARMLRIYFSAFKTTFPDIWRDPDTYLLATNRGVSGLLKLLKSILKAEDNFPTSARFIEYAQALRRHWNWDTSRLQRTYVGSQGWKAFHSDLVAAIKRNPGFRSFTE